MTRDLIGEELAAWGKVLLVETRGRVTGRLTATPVGFVEDPDGAWRVAAGDPEADWALNLRADPRCRVTVGGSEVDAVAEELDGRSHAATVRDLILKYGTPAERLGVGPAFRLRPMPIVRP
ncbi:MAG TPA: nitroreductase family deazaflavin-dependent oxidoreductase [Candidatus Limnocylindrales bacterium]|nr:nitroreductase family deazaflavin-dependent oxidoreductase [Candidatus Limnocylindrales bacterium]